MTNRVRRSVVASVKLGPYDSAEVADRNLQSTCSGSLGPARNIDGGPAERERYRWVDASGGKEHAEIANAWMVVIWSMHGLACDMCRLDVIFVIGQEDDVTNDGNCARCHCEWCSHSYTCRHRCNQDSQNGCQAIRRDSEQLRLIGTVAKGLDDGWLPLVSTAAS